MGVLLIFCYLYMLFLILSAHPFCLWLVMIMWFVTRELMMIQVMLWMHRQQS